ncbi:hypothetical protein Herod_00103 [Acinetobacter phage Herod]|nr:hypothetical protein Herod_00103 [Acinetobacter phage Herod]
MFKGFLTDVAKEAGVGPAILLNQLHQWVKSTGNQKIYRSNAQLHEDLDGVLSVAAIQRHKVKLIECGYIIVSHDKGTIRTTTYQLTEKALKSLGAFFDKAKDKVKQAFQPKKPKENKQPQQQVPAQPKEEPVKQSTDKPTSMEEEFKKAGQERKDRPRGCPKELLKGIFMSAKKEEEKKEDVVYEDNSEELFGKKLESEDLSDEEIFDKMSKTLGGLFKTIPNVDKRNSNLQSMTNFGNFREEY